MSDFGAGLELVPLFGYRGDAFGIAGSRIAIVRVSWRDRFG